MGVLNITKIEPKKLKSLGKEVPVAPIIKLPNYSVEINCLKCGKDFWKRVHALEDIWKAWANTEHCPNCMGKKK